MINEFPGRNLYVTRLEDFHLIPSSLEAIALLTRHGYDVHVISNQGCISRGLLSPEGLQKITDEMIRGVEAVGGRLAGVHYCTHQTSDACNCKKPKTALFRRVLEGKGSVDLEKVYFIGDSEEDIMAAKNLGCRSILVTCGRIAEGEVDALPIRPNEVKANLKEAVHWILKRKY